MKPTRHGDPKSNVEIVSEGEVMGIEVLVNGQPMTGVKAIRIEDMTPCSGLVEATITVVGCALGRREKDSEAEAKGTS